MLTSKNRLHRRSLLRGAGGIALGLPFLSAMLRPGQSHAAEATPTRFVVFYTPGGTLLEEWLPSSSENGLTFRDMLSPLQPFASRITMLQGLNLDITSIGVGHPHSRGMAGILTGTELLPGNFATNGGNASFAAGPSVDQVIAGKISNGLRFKSLEFSAGWSTGLAAGGMPHPANIITYAGKQQPIPPATNPLATLNRIFGDPTQDPEAQRVWSTSIMDAVAEQYRSLSARLGPDDKQKLDAHLAMLEDARQRIQAGVNANCMRPTGIEPDPNFYEDGFTDGPASDGGAHAIGGGVKVPAKGNVMTELLVSALACGSSNVATMEWADSEAKFLLGFLNDPTGKPLADHHHGYQHDRGFQPGALKIIYNFYARQLAHLLASMDAIQEGNGKSLLDNSVILAVSEIQKPDTHDQKNMPLMLIGGGGGKLPGNRLLSLPAQPHNNLLLSLLGLFGGTETSFGNAQFCKGPVAGLV